MLYRMQMRLNLPKRKKVERKKKIRKKFLKIADRFVCKITPKEKNYGF